MSAVTADPRPGLSRRERAARVAEAALRGGLLGAAIAAIAWIAAEVITGTAFLLLLVATIIVVVLQVMRRRVSTNVWMALAAGWAVVLLERWAVHSHGGVLVAAAAWLGVALGARHAGISKWAQPLLAYPVVWAVLLVADHESLLHPWGISWLWVAAVLGPVLGVRTLLNPSPRQPELTPGAPAGRSRR